MTGPISSTPPFQVTPETAGSASVRPVAADASKTASPAISTQEAVTLSADAQATTQLFQAARASDGVNQANVQKIRAALQDGTYDVSPENLAAAMAAALKEGSS